MRRFIVLLIILLTLAGCATAENTKFSNPADYIEMNYIDYPQAPTQYDDVLNYCRWYVDCCTTIKSKHGTAYLEEIELNFEKSYPIDGIRGELYRTDKDKFGYGICDINGDGIQELLLMTSDSEYKYVWEIYSLYQGEPKELMNFALRDMCAAIDKDGTIHYYFSGGAHSNVYGVCTISDGGGLISKEYVWEDAVRDDKGLYHLEYTYFYAVDYDPSDESFKAESIKVDEAEGKKMVEKLKIEDRKDVAPFIEFYPLFI